jgi:hypothetical protein
MSLGDRLVIRGRLTAKFSSQPFFKISSTFLRKVFYF